MALMDIVMKNRPPLVDIDILIPFIKTGLYFYVNVRYAFEINPKETATEIFHYALATVVEIVVHFF